MRASVAALGAGEILLTSMDRDGTKQGFDIALTRAIADAVHGPGDRLRRRRQCSIIWSTASATGHASAVLAASIFHFGEFTVRQAKDYMAKAGLPMRLDP